jgi:hypothetical protein
MAKDSAMQNSAPAISTVMLPSTTAWSLRAWPPLLWQAGRPTRVRFEHLGTRVELFGETPGPASGQTVWAASATDGRAGMAWDWVQVARGVVAIADPMSVVTNLQLLGATGEVLTAQQAARFLNELVRALPWQREVQRALGQRLC